jgi:transcriptional regulator with XRE-family HTH domain
VAEATVSPLARAIRLGHEIRRLREQARISQADLARRVGVARTVLSRIESPTGEPARRADPHTVRAVVGALVDAATLREMDALIWDATAHGWWDGQRGMGAGQQIVAAVECGAERIREFQIALIPGLAQTPEYARHRAEVAPMPAVNASAMVDGRLRRQRQVTEGGTRYELIIAEQALYWLDASVDVMMAQLDHLVALASRPDVSVRVLPFKARLPAGWAPTSPYSIYSYPDPEDPTIVLLDVVGQLLPPLAEPAEVHPYVQLDDRLARASLSDVDSVACIKSAAAWLGGC